MKKSKFNILFEKVMASLIAESGHMFSGCSKIKRENITLTIKKIDEELFIPLGISHNLWTAEIGSAAEGGKKDASGDLDIAVNFAEVDEGGDIDAARKKIWDFATAKGFDMRKQGALISVKFPIQGTQSGEFVQVDLFNSRDLRWSEFRFYSPKQHKIGNPLQAGESKYKGMHRNMILAALVKAVTLAVADDAVDRNKYTAPDGRVFPAYRFKSLSINDDGVFEVTNTYMGKAGKFVSHPQKDESKTREVTRNPQEMLDMLFGKGAYSVSDVSSFESIWDNILFSPSFPYKDKIDEICKALWHGIDKLRMKDPLIEMPEELQDYVDEHHLVE